MNYVTGLILLLVSSAIVNNVVLSQFLGLCPFLGVSKRVETAAGMGGAVIFVITIASFVSSVIYKYVLAPTGFQYMQTIVFILVIAALVQFVEMFLKKSIPSLYKSLGVYLPLITTNCAVLGVTINCISKNYNYGESLVYAVGSAAGFLLSMVVMAGVRERIKIASIPQSFKGSPILYVAAGLLSLAFMGFKGLIK